MSVYAIIENDVVTNVVVGEDEAFLKIVFPNSILVKESEETGKVSVGFGFKNDKFIPIKPWNSWVFNDKTWAWIAPKSYPDDGEIYIWDEPSTSWVKAEIPETSTIAIEIPADEVSE